MKHYQNLLNSHNLKATFPRLALLKNLEKRGHADIDEILSDIKAINPAMTATTLYRNINELLEKQIVSEIVVSKNSYKFELKKEPHIHMVCLECGKIEDLFINMDSIIEKIRDLYKCDIVKNTTLIEILCHECKEIKS